MRLPPSVLCVQRCRCGGGAGMVARACRRTARRLEKLIVGDRGLAGFDCSDAGVQIMATEWCVKSLLVQVQMAGIHRWYNNNRDKQNTARRALERVEDDTASKCTQPLAHTRPRRRLTNATHGADLAGWGTNSVFTFLVPPGLVVILGMGTRLIPAPARVYGSSWSAWGSGRARARARGTHRCAP